MPNYLLYSPDVETIPEGEPETLHKIVEMMTGEQNTTRRKYGHAVRASHAKAHAIVRGTLVVRGDLPLELAQGMFAHAGTYDVLVRMASAPGELLDDSKVNATRGLAIKVFGVPGPTVDGHTEGTHDWVLAPGKAFIAPTAAAFLQAFKPNADIAPKLSDTAKGVFSSIARGTNEVLHALGTDSGKLDFYGHKLVNPLGEAHYSQTPYRYGDYVAKLAVVPDTPYMQSLMDQKFDPKTPDALREAAAAFFREHPAEYSVQVQLATTDEEMPIEDGTAEWPETLSQYQEVARLILPPQGGWSTAIDAVGEPLSWSVDHAMEAHRPLGGINRARRAAYKALSQTRRSENSQPTGEISNPPTLPA